MDPLRPSLNIVLSLFGATLLTAATPGMARASATNSEVARQDSGGTVFLHFLRAPGSAHRLTAPPKLFVSFGGRRTEAVMDTGSTGLVVAASMIPGWESLPSAGPAELTYSSSGRVMEGRWVVTRARIGGRHGAEVRTQPMPVMAVTAIRCLPGARHCVPQDRPRHVAMLGIGFARQGDHQSQSTPDHNPFLRLDSLEAGRARPGYVVTRHGVHAGLGPTSQYESFLTVPLARSTVFADWAAPPVCLSVAGHTPPACGTVLVDTGVSRMFLTVPPEQLEGATLQGPAGPMLRKGTTVGIQLGRAGDPPWGYTFKAGNSRDPRAPQGITLVQPGERPNFVNTSLHVLNGFDYMYDAERGLVGYRALASAP